MSELTRKTNEDGLRLGPFVREDGRIRIHHLYSDTAGVSHFGDIWVEIRGRTSEPFAVKDFMIREAPVGHNTGWHLPTHKHYIVNLDGAIEIAASDGEVRIIGIGDIILIEDHTGKGHLSKSVENKIRRSLYLTPQ